jgi:hypothetical protein
VRQRSYTTRAFLGLGGHPRSRRAQSVTPLRCPGRSDHCKRTTARDQSRHLVGNGLCPSQPRCSLPGIHAGALHLPRERFESILPRWTRLAPDSLVNCREIRSRGGPGRGCAHGAGLRLPRGPRAPRAGTPRAHATRPRAPDLAPEGAVVPHYSSPGEDGYFA